MSKQFGLLLTSIFMFGLSAFFRKLAVDRIHPYQLQIIGAGVYTLSVPLWLYLLKSQASLVWDRAGLAWGIICFIVYIVGAVIFGVLLKESTNPGVLTTLSSLWPIVTMILTVTFLGETLTLNKLIAAALMVSGFALFNWK